MKTKFRIVEDGCVYDAASVLNKWLEENPGVEIVSWQCLRMSRSNYIKIVIQYREVE